MGHPDLDKLQGNPQPLVFTLEMVEVRNSSMIFFFGGAVLHEGGQRSLIST